MPLTSIQKIFRLFYQFFSKGKNLLLRSLPSRLNCCVINYYSSGSGDRVSIINNAAPDCVCEKHSMSKNSPHPVNDNERITRFVFIENHLSRDKKSVKPNFFSHTESKGCSIQRESIIEGNELVTFVKKYREKNPKSNWYGVVTGSCQEIRRILTNQDKRAYCVYDTGYKINPAHGEICKTHHIIEEADRLELRSRLRKIFSNGSIIHPNEYREGIVLSQI